MDQWNYVGIDNPIELTEINVPSQGRSNTDLPQNVNNTSQLLDDVPAEAPKPEEKNEDGMVTMTSKWGDMEADPLGRRGQRPGARRREKPLEVWPVDNLLFNG